jgi:hypothetical protein
MKKWSVRGIHVIDCPHHMYGGDGEAGRVAESLQAAQIHLFLLFLSRDENQHSFPNVLCGSPVARSVTLATELRALSMKLFLRGGRGISSAP